MPARYLTESDVEQLIDMRTAVDVVQEAFRQLGSGQAENVPRHRAMAAGMVLHTMSATAAYLGVVGWKSYTTTRQGARFLVGLFSMESGLPLALIEADRLGQMRTGATTGVALEWLAPPDLSEIGLVGTGWQARAQLAAAATVRRLRRAFVYSRDPDRRTTFAEEMSESLGIEVRAVDRPQEAVEDLPVVITATNSREPVLDGRWLAEGTVLCAIGSNWLGRAELDSSSIARAGRIVCDSVACCRQEAGDFQDAIQRGLFDWSRAVDLADVVTGRAPARGHQSGLLLFKSVGMAIEDVALGAKVLERAQARGAGCELPF